MQRPLGASTAKIGSRLRAALVESEDIAKVDLNGLSAPCVISDMHILRSRCGVLSSMPLTNLVYLKNLPVIGPVPPARYFHGAVLSLDESTIFVHGGINNEGSLNDLWAFQIASRTWQCLWDGRTLAGPEGRYAHTVTIWRESLLVFGGANLGGQCLEDLHLFNFASSQWTQLNVSGISPSPRRGCSAVLSGDCLWIFGGNDGLQSLNDLHMLNLASLTWQSVQSTGQSPSPRCFHSASLSTRPADTMILFGGSSDGSQFLLDTTLYALSLTSRTWSAVPVASPPPLMQGHSAAIILDSLFILGRDLRSKMHWVCQLQFETRQWQCTPLEEQHGAFLHFNAAVATSEAIFITGGVDDTRTCSSGVQVLGFPSQIQEKENELEMDEETKRLSRLPPSQWEAAAMRRHPDVLELRERLKVVSSTTPSYARLYYTRQVNETLSEGQTRVVEEVQFPPRTDNKEALSHQLVLQLVMGHLSACGRTKTVKAIEEETGTLFKPEEEGASQETRLRALLRIAMRRVRQKNDLFAPQLQLTEREKNEDEVVVLDHLQLDEKGDAADTPVWTELMDSSQSNVIKTKEELKAASLNKLIELLVPEGVKPQATFVRVFLTTYRSFTTPKTLLHKLVERYHVPTNMITTDMGEQLVASVHRNVLDILRTWLEKQPGDFNEKLLQECLTFFDGLAKEDYTMASQLRARVTKLLQSKERKGADDSALTVAKSSTPPPEPKVTLAIFSKKLHMLDIDDEELARQMTLMDFEIFANMQSAELLKKGWLELYQKNKSPHVKQLRDRANRLSNWLCQQVMSQDSKRKKAAHFEKFIKVAQHLRAMCNFQTLFAVLNGLFHPLSRTLFNSLEIQPRTKELLTSFDQLRTEGRRYKEALKQAAATPGQPVVPNIDAILNDILEIEATMPDNIRAPSGDTQLINWTKRMQIYAQLQAIQSFQSLPYNLQPVLQIQSLLEVRVMEFMDEASLAKLAADNNK